MLVLDEDKLECYWQSIPVGKANAYSYEILCSIWRRDKRTTREILHQLSRYDNGDDLILIRSSRGAGFYRTNNACEINAYRAECLSKGRSTLAPLKKIDRVMKPDDGQLSIDNNLRAVRTSLGYSAAMVCEKMQVFDPAFGMPMLSKMERGKCLPTQYQLAHLACIYGCTLRDLLNMDLYQTAI